MESLQSLPPHEKTGEFQLKAATIKRVYPQVATIYKCTYLHAQDSGEAFVITFDFTPPTPGAITAGNCSGSRADSPPFYHSRKRYLTVSGGPRRLFTRAAGGDEMILKQALRLAEAQGVGQACPRR
jgi:hypothetical protein